MAESQSGDHRYARACELAEVREINSNEVTLRAPVARDYDVSAMESFRAQSVIAQITPRFTIRYSNQFANVNLKDRISFEGRLYNITAVRVAAEGRRATLEIDAVARAE